MNETNKDLTASIIAAILTAIILAAFLSVQINSVRKVTNALPQTKLYGSGDVNNDGRLTQEDLDIIVTFVFKQSLPTLEEFKASDANGDGKLSSSDLTVICIKIEAGY